MEEGWWAYQIEQELNVSASQTSSVMVYQTTRCPVDFCPGSILQGRPPNSSADSQYALCKYPRVDSPTNWVCAACAPGYIAWSQDCVQCTETNGFLLSLVLIGCLLLVCFLFYSGSSSAGQLTILLFFVQTAALEVGSISAAVDWLQWANLSASSTRSCIAPLQPLQQLLVTFFSPAILTVCLIFIGFLHYLICRCTSDSSTSTLLRRLRGSLSSHRYIGGFSSVLLFCYTPTTIAVVQALHCVDVAPGVSLLYALPTVDCSSAEYHSFRIIAILFLIGFVIGFPLAILVFMYSRGRQRAFAPSHLEDLRVSLTSASSPAMGHSYGSMQSFDATLTPFELRWGPFFRGYKASTFFWQPLVLLRRFAFALVAVLMANTSSRFSVYAILHTTSLLVHLRVQPFTLRSLNAGETASYVVLMYLSMVLSSSSPPYSLAFQIFLFLLTVPPAVVLLGWTMRHHIGVLRGKCFSPAKPEGTDQTPGTPSEDDDVVVDEQSSELGVEPIRSGASSASHPHSYEAHFLPRSLSISASGPRP